MKKSRLYAILLLIFSVASVLALAVWNFVQDRTTAFEIHERWAKKISETIAAERMESSRWLESLRGMSLPRLRGELFSHPDVAGAYWFDIRSHEFERIVRPRYAHAL